MEANKGVPVQSVKKALDLLDVLVFEDPGREGMSLSDLAKRSGAPANSTHNLLKSMELCGYVAHDADGRYVAGPKLAQVGKLNWVRSESQTRAAREQLAAFADLFGEAVVFVTLYGGRRVTLVRVDCDQAVKVDHARYEGDNIWQTPTGRMLAAWTGPEELAAVLAVNGLPGKRWLKIRGSAALRKGLARIREAGLCELEPERRHVRAWAVPVVDEGGAFWGALGCYAPVYRCDEARGREIVRELRDEAGRLAAGLRA